MQWKLTSNELPEKNHIVIGYIKEETCQTIYTPLFFFLNDEDNWVISDYFGNEETGLVPVVWRYLDSPPKDLLQKKV